MKTFKPKEVWKNITNYNLYLVSNLGRIKRIYMSSKIILKPQLSNCGYMRVQLAYNNKYKKYPIHRLVLMTFIPTKKKLQVNHINGIKTDNRLDNLEWATAKQNVQHAFKNKLRVTPKGEQCSWAKLNEEAIIGIRNAFKTGFWNMRELAELYKVNKTTIFDIIHRKIWRHI